jgi:hypothetical protein
MVAATKNGDGSSLAGKSVMLRENTIGRDCVFTPWHNKTPRPFTLPARKPGQCVEVQGDKAVLQLYYEQSGRTVTGVVPVSALSAV